VLVLAAAQVVVRPVVALLEAVPLLAVVQQQAVLPLRAAQLQQPVRQQLQLQQRLVWWRLVWRLWLSWLQQRLRKTKLSLLKQPPPPQLSQLPAPNNTNFTFLKAPLWGRFFIDLSAGLFFRMQFLGHVRFILLLLFGPVLCSCGSLRPPEYVGALTSSLQSRVENNDILKDLKPGFEYILIEIGGRKTTMALGSREVMVLQGQEQVHERWYSGQREMIHMVNGRLQTAVGLTVEWRHQRSIPPAWVMVDQTQDHLTWSRELDIMPGYRFGHTDQLQTRVSSAPKGAPILPSDTRWFSDWVRSPQPLGGEWVFEQHFALYQGRVVYSEQCLAPTVCFKFQPLGLVR
jgi:hypothetical protein